MSLIIASLLALLISISAFGARVDAKPLNQNQVKFRRLPPKEFSAALGSSITIECEAGGSPPPIIHWLKNGKRILQSEFDDNQLDDGQYLQADDFNRGERIAISSTRSRLFIDCTDYEDEAVYTCVAENEYSRISSHTKLNLIRPLPPLAGSENDLLSGTLDDVAALELAAATSNGGVGAPPSASHVSGEMELPGKSLSAIPQCLSRRGPQTIEPVRIYMWTHNIVEVMKNSVILYCRSNVKKQPIAANSQQEQSQQDSSSVITSSDLSINKLKPSTETQQQRSLVTWSLPDEKLVGPDQKDKYEILDTGDLLIKDLRWADMGSYVCTVSDDQSSDSISTFVYPASVRASTNKRTTMNPRLADFR